MCQTSMKWSEDSFKLGSNRFGPKQSGHELSDLRNRSFPEPILLSEHLVVFSLEGDSLSNRV